MSIMKKAINNAPLTLCKGLILGLSLILISLPSFAKPITDEFTDENFAIIDLTYKRYIIGQGIEAYIIGNTEYLPIASIAAAIELDVSLKENMVTAKNHIINKSFTLREENGAWFAKINSKPPVKLSPSDAVMFDGLLYVKSEIIQKWIGGELDFNFSTSTLRLSGDTKFPFLKNIKRSNRTIGNNRFIRTPSEDPTLNKPYKFIEIPSIDLSTRSYAQRNLKESKSNYNRKNAYSIRTRGDLGYMSGSTFFSADDSALKGAHISFDRLDHSASMFGFLEATRLSFGDINTESTRGRGILINNKKIGANYSTSKTTIEGYNQPGWDVELTHNNVVIKAMTIGEDGRYLFEDIPITTGSNFFTLKFYGPGGREESETREVISGVNPDDVGKIKYSFSYTQPRAKTIETDQIPNPEDLYDEFALGLQYGFTPFLSIDTGIRQELNHENDTGEDNAAFGYIGLHASFGNTRHSLRAEEDANGTQRISYSGSGATNYFAYQFGYSNYSNSEPEFNYEGNEYSFSLVSQLADWSNSLYARHAVNLETVNDKITWGLSRSKRRTSISNFLDYERTSYEAPTTEENELMTGLFSVKHSLRPLSVRIGAKYTVLPEYEIDSAFLGSSFRIANGINVNFDIDHRLVSNDTNYRLGLTWKNRYLRVTPSINYSDEGLFQGLLTVSTSLGKRTNSNGNYSHYDMSSLSSSSRGAIKLRTFDDINGDGLYSYGEPLIEGAEVHLEQFKRLGISNEKGEIFINNVSPWRPTDVNYISGTSLSDPVAYSGEAFSVVARPGSVIGINMPMVKVSEVSGYIYQNSEPNKKIAGQVVVVLNDTEGNKIDRQLSDSSGYFFFEGVKPGKYKLDIAGRKLLANSKKEIIVGRDGDYITGIQLIIEPENQISNDLFAISNNTEVEPISPTEEINSVVAPPIPEPAPVIATPSALPEPPISDKPFWTLQIASYKQEQLAENLKERLIKAGYPAFIKKATISNNVYNRVYAGKAELATDLQTDRQVINRLLRVQSFPVKIDS